MTTTTETYERSGFPRATATRDSVTGHIVVVVDNISGLDPGRVVSSEETGMGIDSLDPPTASGDSARSVIDRAVLAVSAAVDATLGAGTAPQILWTRYRTAVAVKGALAALGLSV